MGRKAPVLTNRHHAIQRYFCPLFLIVGYDDAVHDMVIGKILHRPAEVRCIDTKHCRTLADSRGQEEDFLIG